jgi:hypothetical protein
MLLIVKAKIRRDSLLWKVDSRSDENPHHWTKYRYWICPVMSVKPRASRPGSSVHILAGEQRSVSVLMERSICVVPG